MSFKMFRYLEHNYLGKYRVLAHYDEEAGDFPRDDKGSILEDYDEQYIPTSRKGEIRTSYRNTRGKDILAWYCPSHQVCNNVVKEIKKKYPNIWIEVDEELGSGDGIFYFDAKDLDDLATILKPKTYGAKIRPYSVKNLPKNPYLIPEKDLEKLNKLFKEYDATVKMRLMRTCCSRFDEVIISKKGKKYNLTLERKKSKLKPKEFIHSIGMWDEFIKYVKDFIKDLD